jgi:hypothetical protein
MAVQAYTDLFNNAINDLATTLNDVTGLTVYTDPRNITPGVGFALIGSPSFNTYSPGIVSMTFPIQVMSTGPANEDALRNLLNTASKVFGARIGTMEGRPITLDIGGSMLPCYELLLNLQAQI